MSEKPIRYEIDIREWIGWNWATYTLLMSEDVFHNHTMSFPTKEGTWHIRFEPDPNYQPEDNQDN